MLLADGGWFFHRGFFLDPGARRRVVESVRVAHPEAIPATIESAEQICTHRFDLLGSGLTDLGPQIDWHRDFKGGFCWDPRGFSSRLRYGDVIGADVKVPWELSRFQHLATLGKAYWLTNDSRYATEFVAQLTHWMAENPPQFGVNWACTMDVAIRAFNWLWGYSFFHDAPQVTPAFRRALAGSLLAHGRHVRRNLERGADGITSNHYLADLVGLVGLGFACPIFHEAQAWREFSLTETFREIERQVHPDGGDYESSIPYHRLVAEIVLGRRDPLPPERRRAAGAVFPASPGHAGFHPGVHEAERAGAAVGRCRRRPASYPCRLSGVGPPRSSAPVGDRRSVLRAAGLAPRRRSEDRRTPLAAGGPGLRRTSAVLPLPSVAEPSQTPVCT